MRAQSISKTNRPKSRAAITWVSAANGREAEVPTLPFSYDRLFADAQPEQEFQFERRGYFVADRQDHVAGRQPVFNRVTGLKDSCGK